MYKIILFLYCLQIVYASYFASLPPSSFALVQFDSRPLGSYWGSAALWNQRYAHRHSHAFIYYAAQSCFHTGNAGLGATQLADPWCKVRAMLADMEDFPHIQVFVYMDSDAVVSAHAANTSLSAYLAFVQNKINWDIQKKPIIFNQDGPCWWCDLIVKAGYSTCLNSGTVAYIRFCFLFFCFLLLL